MKNKEETRGEDRLGGRERKRREDKERKKKEMKKDETLTNERENVSRTYSTLTLRYSWQFRFAISLVSLVENLVPETRHRRSFIV